MPIYDLQSRVDSLSRSGRRPFANVIHLPRTVGRWLRWPFARIAFHKNGRPRAWILSLMANRRPGRPDGQIQALSISVEPAPTEERPDAILAAPTSSMRQEGSVAIIDARKRTILVISHEATRSGAPILALNLIQHLSARYNVIGLLLGVGELTDNFRQASASLYVAERAQMSDGQLSGVIEEITTRYPLMFTIANTVESRRVLGALKERGVPTVSLIHEFASYMRPGSVFQDAVSLSTETVFSTELTLNSAVVDTWLYPSTSIHVAPTGKCNVPAAARTSHSEEQLNSLWSRRYSLPPARRKFLVIGVGTVEIRKGVDIFISCAAIIKNQNGGERFQFLWIGRGFDPETDVNYSVYLADQIKRAGIQVVPPYCSFDKPN